MTPCTCHGNNDCNNMFSSNVCGKSAGCDTTNGPVYDRFAPASEVMWVPTWFAILDPVATYYKFNLAQAYFSPLLFLEDQPVPRGNYMKAYNLLWRATSHHKERLLRSRQNFDRSLGKTDDNRAGASQRYSACATPGRDTGAPYRVANTTAASRCAKRLAVQQSCGSEISGRALAREDRRVYSSQR
jgi:hypothetical protein